MRERESESVRERVCVCVCVCCCMCFIMFFLVASLTPLYSKFSVKIPQIRTIDRCKEIPHQGPFCDLVWSDPEDIETWAISPRGAGYLFGRKVTKEVS